MRVIIIIFLIIFPYITSAENQRDILIISVFFNRGQAGIKSIENSTGYLPGEKIVDKNSLAYWIELIAEDGEVLLRKEFNVYLQLVSEHFSEDESVAPETSYIHLDETTSVVIVPYYQNIKWLNLYDANRNLIERKDVEYLSQVCGNGICQNQEDGANCPKDCANDKNQESAPGNIQQNGQNASADRADGNMTFLLLGTLGLSLAAGIIFFILHYRRRKSDIGKPDKDNGSFNP